MRLRVSSAMLLAATFAANPDAFASPPYASGPGRMRRITAASLAALEPVPAVDVMGLAV